MRLHNPYPLHPVIQGPYPAWGISKQEELLTKAGGRKTDSEIKTSVKFLNDSTHSGEKLKTESFLNKLNIGAANLLKPFTNLR